jgi:hypothetical protein
MTPIVLKRAPKDRDGLETFAKFLLFMTSEEAVADDTYFPIVSSIDEAVDWLLSFPSETWLVEFEKSVAGILMVHRPQSEEIPDGYLETGTFIVKQFRRRGIASAAWAMAEPQLAGRVIGLAGIPWETNLASIARLRKSGFTRHSRIWYQAQQTNERSGWCEMWLKELSDETTVNS